MDQSRCKYFRKETKRGHEEVTNNAYLWWQMNPLYNNPWYLSEFQEDGWDEESQEDDF